jgi:phloretin hydrolase
MSRAVLTQSEKQLPYHQYFNRPSAIIPDSVLESIQHHSYPCEQALELENLNDLLLPGYLPMENGYCRMPDGSLFVAVRTEFPTATDPMFDWWFAWHAQEPFRYRIWYPECHFDVKVNVLQPPSLNQPAYWNTIHYPVEDIGLGRETLSIHFVPPAEFCFDVSRFAEANIVTAICGLVGSVDKHLKQQAYMCHLVRRIAGGYEMRSRFWIGRDIRFNPFIGSAIVERLVNTRIARMLSLPSRMGLAMALHCAQEYNNLSEILPELYSVYKQD